MKGLKHNIKKEQFTGKDGGGKMVDWLLVTLFLLEGGIKLAGSATGTVSPSNNLYTKYITYKKVKILKNFRI